MVKLFWVWEMRDKKRGTGRTTRMLKHALELDDAGRAVYIIGANHQHCRMLFDMLVKLAPKGCIASESSLQVNGIKIETAEQLGNFDWTIMKLRSAHPNCVTLVDHYAIESGFNLMLRMLEAYDE